MKIIINKDYFNVTLETKKEYIHPYQMRKLLKTALQIDGFSDIIIKELFNEQDVESKCSIGNEND